MRTDYRFFAAPTLALTFAIACGDSDTVVSGKGTGGADSGSSTGGSSDGGAGGKASGGTGGTGTGGRNSTGGSSGSANGGASGTTGDASAGASGDGGPVGDGAAAGGSAGTGGATAGGAGGKAAGGAGGKAAGGAGGMGTGGSTVGTACQRLGNCCDGLQAPLKTSCNSYANAGVQSNCVALIGAFCAGQDAGPVPPPPDAANACSALSACCPQSGPQRANCDQTVSAGNPALCSAVLSLLCP
jgi:hypothetical protein